MGIGRTWLKLRFLSGRGLPPDEDNQGGGSDAAGLIVLVVIAFIGLAFLLERFELWLAAWLDSTLRPFVMRAPLVLSIALGTAISSLIFLIPPYRPEQAVDYLDDEEGYFTDVVIGWMSVGAVVGIYVLDSRYAITDASEFTLFRVLIALPMAFVLILAVIGVVVYAIILTPWRGHRLLTVAPKGRLLSFSFTFPFVWILLVGILNLPFELWVPFWIGMAVFLAPFWAPVFLVAWQSQRIRFVAEDE